MSKKSEESGTRLWNWSRLVLGLGAKILEQFQNFWARDRDRVQKIGPGTQSYSALCVCVYVYMYVCMYAMYVCMYG